MKKILLLGGSAQQVIAIKKAKEMGLYTILCDYLPDNPGQYTADKFYLVSTTDMEAVLNIAKKEEVSAVLAYASDPAAPTAAYVSEAMGLNTNPYKSVDMLCNKDKFRQFLSQNNFAVPGAEGFSDNAKAYEYAICAKLPLIIKPVDSSGSKGVSVIREKNSLLSAIDLAFNYSRSGRIVIEQYIERNHEYLIGGDIFVANGKIIMWGLMNCHRDDNVNPLVPVGKSYPVMIDANSIDMVKITLQSLVDKLNIQSGAMNVELIIDSRNKVYLIDVGPRSGGNMIPDLLSYIFGVDVVEMTIKASLGKLNIKEIKAKNTFMATHNLHSDKNGTFNGIEFTNEIEKYIVKKCIYKNIGDKIEYFSNASKALGIVFMEFDSKSNMQKILNNINNHIKINCAL